MRLRTVSRRSPAPNGEADGAAPDFAQHKQRELAKIAAVLTSRR